MSKKIVRYRLDKPFVIHVGMTAYITPIDHPDCSNTGMVRTSEVIGVPLKLRTQSMWENDMTWAEEKLRRLSDWIKDNTFSIRNIIEEIRGYKYE